MVQWTSHFTISITLVNACKLRLHQSAFTLELLTQSFPNQPWLGVQDSNLGPLD